VASIDESLARAIQLHQSGDLAAAQQIYRQILAQDPSHADALHLLGMVSFQTGQLDSAVELIQRAIAADPSAVPFHSNLGGVFQAQGKRLEAEQCFRHAVRLAPDFSDAHYNLGIVLQEQNKLSEAIASFRRAIAIHPEHAGALNNLGNALLRSGNAAEAIVCFRKALQKDPASAQLHYNLGGALQELGQLPAAVAAFRRALQIKPDYADVFNNLGNVLLDQGQTAEAVDCYRQALQAKPDLLEVRCNLVYQLQLQCCWDEVEKLSEPIVQAVNVDAGRTDDPPITPFCFLALPTPTTAEQQHRCATTFVRQQLGPIMALAPEVRFRYANSERPKIHIGYLSADFRAHPVGLSLVEVLEQHDRSAFEVAAYSCGPDDGSVTRQRIVKGVDRFIEMGGDSFINAARRIHADRIDILVDLMGHTRRARTEILALRPAPIQVHYLGYPGTMGAPFIDYLIADEFVIPRDHTPFYTEKVAYLPRCFFPNDSQRTVTPDKTSRSYWDLPADARIFCCFNNSYKFNPMMFGAWMRLLLAVPGSLLWLPKMSREADQHLRQQAAARGVPPERLVFARTLPLLADHLARYRVADLFLDTFPYNAHSTASEALSSGCPVLTLTGQTFASRVAASLLHAADLPELVTHGLAEYEEKALYLAQNPTELARLRSQLAENRVDNPLYDGASIARALEQAFRTMWNRYLAGEAPQTFRVEGDA
jgi:predicted O-linked N-acetylglucosamine transferase (SPINDLY family)